MISRSDPRICGRLTFIAALIVTIVGLGSPASAAASEDTRKAAMGALELAKHHYRKEHFVKASNLFLEAFQIDPNPGFLFNAGRSLQRAFKLDASQKTFEWYLRVEKKDQRGRGRAKMHLSEIRTTRLQLARARKEGAKPAVAPTASTATKISNKAATPKGATLGWVSTAGGGALTLAGVGLLAYAEVLAQRATDSISMAAGSSVSELTRAAYEAETQRVSRLRLAGGISLGVGVVGAAIGAWLLTRPASGSVALVPQPGGGMFTAKVLF